MTINGENGEFKLPAGYATTHVGKYKGIPVMAITDGAGPNVIVGGRSYKKHLVSLQLPSHEEAVELAQRVVDNGPGVYDAWFDYKDQSQSMEAFNYMMACMASKKRSVE